MTDVNHYTAIGKSGEGFEITIASGPVIIKDNKVLIDKHGEDTFWKFPGGKQADNLNFKGNAIKRVKEELGIKIKIINERPSIFIYEREHNNKKEYVILIHYLADIISGKPKPGKNIREFIWADINNLPSDCGPHIKSVTDYFMKQ
jgi:ADP-ribose pyrophosphatase YjhB (NUDIX family)